MQSKSTRSEAALLHDFVDHLPDLAWSATADGSIDFFNRRCYEYAGTDFLAMAGWSWQDWIHPASVDEVLDRWRRAIAAGDRFEMEFPIRAADGNFHWFLARVAPVHDERGELLRWFGMCMRIDEQRAARERARFLADVSSVLAESLDYDANLEKLARLAIPTFAGFCIVDVLNDDGTFRRVATAAIAPEKERLLEALRERFPIEDSSTQPAARAHRARAPIVMRFPDERALATTTRSPEHFDLVRRLGPRAAIACPMIVHAEVIGMLTFGFFEELEDEADALALANELAHRAGMTLESARLYRRSRLAEAERARLLAAEHAAHEEAERDSRAKDEFFAMVSHELRAPLTAILGWTQLLRAGELPEEKRKKALATIERSALQQAELIDDLLDLSRVVSGTLRLELKPVHVVTVLEAALESAGPALSAKQLRLETKLESTTREVKADPTRLQQVVWNLLANAAKFTPRHGTVRVSLAMRDEWVELAVADSGVGIPAAFLPRIFDRFEQANRNAARKHGGLGLGLSIAKSIVEMHGGSITAESDGEGRGSTFRVRLPTSVVT
jgi:PAS domain S-box-containing protein